MAKIIELKSAEWNKWVATRPQIIQDLCNRLPPDRLYKMTSTGHRVFLYSYQENGTVTVVVSGEFNAIIFPRRVFGVKPDDLIECDLPAENDAVGSVLNDRGDIDNFINQIKENQ